MSYIDYYKTEYPGWFAHYHKPAFNTTASIRGHILNSMIVKFGAKDEDDLVNILAAQHTYSQAVRCGVEE